MKFQRILPYPNPTRFCEDRGQRGCLVEARSLPLDDDDDDDDDDDGYIYIMVINKQ